MRALHALSAFLLPAALLASLTPAAAADLKLYKDLQNDYIKVTSVKETEKIEEKYVDVGGRLELKKIPRKEVLVTAEITNKPPSTMENMFGDPQAEPFFKICATFYDQNDTPGDEECQAIRFHRPVKGDIGTLGIPYPPEAVRYALRLIKRVDSTSGPIKLWVPTN